MEEGGGGSALVVVSYCVGLSRVSEKTQFFLLDSFHSKRKERKHAIFKCCCCFQLHSNHNLIPMALFISSLYWRELCSSSSSSPFYLLVLKEEN